MKRLYGVKRIWFAVFEYIVALILSVWAFAPREEKWISILLLIVICVLVLSGFFNVEIGRDECNKDEPNE